MTEKRFVYYEHKGADYILDTPNKNLDFIEMLGDCLEAEEIVNLLNDLSAENEELKQFKEKVFTLIEEELEEHPYLTLTEKWNPNCKNYHSCRGYERCNKKIK